MNRRLLLVVIWFVCVLAAGCQNTETQTQESVDKYRMGQLPPQSDALLAEEFSIYRKQHPEMDEAAARESFDIIQVMSAEAHDDFVAKWAERRALSQRWLKTQIEDVYAPSTVNDEFVQAAIDAYAFKSGHPALVTASHILIRPDKRSTAETRKAALSEVRKQLLAKTTITDNDLREAAQMLTRAGFRTDMNPDLTFPRHPMTSFMGEQLNHQAVVEPFAAAAFALSQENRLSDVVESEFGYHIILYKSRTEEKKATLENDREFMVSNIVSHGRQVAVRQTISELMNQCEVQVDESRLAELTK